VNTRDNLKELLVGLAQLRGRAEDAYLPATYRNVAEELRQLAGRVRHVPDIRADLLELSARFERMAAYYTAQANQSCGENRTTSQT
jgi:hypothetical protein